MQPWVLGLMNTLIFHVVITGLSHEKVNQYVSDNIGNINEHAVKLSTPDDSSGHHGFTLGSRWKSHLQRVSPLH